MTAHFPPGRLVQLSPTSDHTLRGIRFIKPVDVPNPGADTADVAV